ncbi:DUF4365 domain-containing protein [Lysinibacillus fusiformis]|uniref:DUF4365 domain-containing protein n=1 Tax=Lysinibacillus fusiformis TaxID=28031 RepID=UPI00119D15A3|nr:DUF4365 domain-containing protein [Lysinibacillus fusiformis]
MSINKLNKIQIGRYAENLMKIEFMRLGLEVYPSEVDDRGIDFVVGHDNNYYAIQVKSSRNLNYIYFKKDNFQPRVNLLAAIVLFNPSDTPSFYLIPSTRWDSPDGFFVSRDYLDKKSKPEYGLNLSKRNLPFLETYSIDNVFYNFL